MFWEERKKALYGNLYFEKMKLLPYAKDAVFRYFIWGAGQIGKEAVRCIKEYYPNSILIGVIDTYSYGKDFMGVTIEPPELIEKKYLNYFCVITTYSGQDFVINYLNKIKKESYISFASVNG